MSLNAKSLGRSVGRSRWARHLLFAGVNAALAALAWLAMVEPLLHLVGERAERIAERETTLARYEAIATQENAVRDYARQIADSNARGELLAGESEGIINANLQARLKTLAEQAGVTVRSIQMLPAKSVRGAALVGARLDVAGRLDPIHALTRALEGEAPLLIIMAAALRGQTMPWAMPTSGEPDIDAQFDVYGGALSKERS
jgi:hypothetical protein